MENAAAKLKFLLPSPEHESAFTTEAAARQCVLEGRGHGPSSLVRVARVPDDTGIAADDVTWGHSTRISERALIPAVDVAGPTLTSVGG